MEGVGFGEACAQRSSEVGDVVVEKDAGDDVLGGSDRQWGVDQAAVAGEDVVDGDVLEARVENSGVEKDEAHVSAAGGGDLGRVDIRAAGEVIGDACDVVDAHAYEGAADQVGAKAE